MEHIKTFKGYVQKVFPAIYDDSLSYFELLSKIIEHLRSMGKTVNDLIDLYNSIEEYIDKQLITEVGNKLDQLVASGEFDDIIANRVFTEFNDRLNSIALHVKQFGAKGDGTTDDTDSLVSALNEASRLNATLDFGDGVYTVTGNLPNFHFVNKIGRGHIVRENIIFYITPLDSYTNNLYVATNGSNSNDGLTPLKPLADIQTAFDTLVDYENKLHGTWRINVAAGTYKGAMLKDGLLSDNPIELKGADTGGHPNIPSTIISEGLGVSSVGTRVRFGSRLKVIDIKYVGYNGTTSSCGIQAAFDSYLYTSNVHTNQCFYGISGQKANIEIPDGIHDNNGRLQSTGGGSGAAIRSLMLNRHHVGIQNAGSRDKCAIFTNNRQAFFCQENSTGHVDWSTFENNEYGITARVNSRVNADGSYFDNNNVDIRTDSSHIYISNSVVFSGTSNAKIVRTNGGQVTTTRLFQGMINDMGYSTTENTIYKNITRRMINGTTASRFFETTLPAGLWKSIVQTTIPMKKISFTVIGEMDSTQGFKRINFRLGTQVINVTFIASGSGRFVAEGFVVFGEGQQIMMIKSDEHLASNRLSIARPTNPLDINTTLSLEGVVETEGDSFYIDYVEIKLEG